jgi:hypothetical protein
MSIMQIFGVPVSIWHGLVVEEHTGIAIFIIVALFARLLMDIAVRGKQPSPRVLTIRQGTDFVGFAGSALVVLFLVVSGVTGYLIQPYSSLIASPILINKSLLALVALFFWTMFFVVRYLMGPQLWEKRGLYSLQFVTAILGIFFTALTASMGAELTVGQSAMEPLYSALNFSWKTFLVAPTAILATAALIAVGVFVAYVLPILQRTSNHAP